MFRQRLQVLFRASGPRHHNARKASTARGKFAAACALVAGLNMGAASAAVVTYQTSFEVDQISLLERLATRQQDLVTTTFDLGSLRRFDATLGTLTGVLFGFMSTVDLSVQGGAGDSSTGYAGELFPSDAAFDALLRADLTLGLFDPSGATNFTGGAQLADSCQAQSDVEYARCSISRSQTRSLNAELGLAGVALDAFIGTDPINFFASVVSSLTSNCQVDFDGVDTCYFVSGTGARWSGLATVAYTYNAVGGPGGVGGGGAGNTVPEPSSLALLALGGLGLAGAARTRRRRC